MLGRLGMTVEEALKKYGEFSKDIFYKRKLFWQDGSYKATKLKEAVCKTVQEYGIAEDEQEKLLSQAIGRESCKVYDSMCMPTGT